MSDADQKKDQRRREILEAAKETFAERGFHQSSINHIIKRADIARGTFYLYFPSKDAVFESILDHAIEDLRERIVPVETSEGARPMGVQLHDNVTRVLEFVLGDRALIRLVLAHGLAPDTDIAKRVEAFFGHVKDLIEASLRYGLSMGLVRECDPDLVASAVLGAIRGAVRHLVAESDEPDVPKIAEQLIDFTLRGVVVADRW